MATPVSGAISMSDMRSEVTRGTGAVSMSDIRAMIQGGSGSISFSNCRGLKGFPNHPMSYVAANKYVPETDGITSTTGLSGNTYYQIQTGVDVYFTYLRNTPATAANAEGAFTYANGTIVNNSTTFGENQITYVYYNGTQSSSILHDTAYFGAINDWFTATGISMANTGTANVVLRFSG